ncbi:MAG: BREX system ATP-binding protein BrxD [Planctomycetota bacterium]|nr:MAG: BREX system ATP-binding protein BrxD [Planctomycetota bacterium]
MISPQRRHDIIDALRRGTVPQRSLDIFATGLESFVDTLQSERNRVAQGGAVFKCVRGDYGTGKTFFARWLQEQAKNEGFATAEVQISETETPLHKLETVYRRLMERLATTESDHGALRSIIDAWFFCLEEDVLAEGSVDANNSSALLEATDHLLTKRLAEITKTNPAFAAGLRGYRQAVLDNDHQAAEGLIAWLAGQPNVAAAVKRKAGIKGDIDHFGALSCLQGLLVMLRDSGKPGLLVVLDEVETLQRVRGDVREKSLNALRQLIDEIDAGRFPGLYLVITGTPAFFDGNQGVQRLPPLAQRLHVDFATESRFDNPRAVQIRLSPFTIDRLTTVGIKIRDIFADGSAQTPRIRSLVDDSYIADLARAVTGGLGGKVGVAPRIFLKKLVGEVLDRVDQFADFDPRQHYELTINASEKNEVEAAASVDDVDLDI